jgi:hypothetical protein
MLIHQLPPKPLYLRARVRNSLARIGAVALKNAVYVVPRGKRGGGVIESLRAIAAEAVQGGGEAFLCEAQFLDAAIDALLIRESRAARDADYEALARSIAESPDAPALARARKRFERIERIDFFQSDGQKRLKDLLGRAEARAGRSPVAARDPLAKWKGRLWATRRGLHIDRIASAWLIRRFLDPKARFRFVDPKQPSAPRELRFDMQAGDFTHEGDRCTFETLIARTGLRNRALSEVAEIVHDVDLKDGKFARPEAARVERLIHGLLLETSGDEERLERGLDLFDRLYRSLASAKRGVTAREKK